MNGTQERRGGWRNNPASLAALARSRPLDLAHMRQCYQTARSTGVQCRARACQPSGLCMFHGGLRGRPVSPERQQRRDARNYVWREDKAGRVPTSLKAMPVWYACASKRALVMRPILLRAWWSADPAEWPRAVARAESIIKS